jgi:hypothetical protein
VRTFRLAAAAVAAVTAASLVAGCSGDDAEPGVSPSETSTESSSETSTDSATGSTEPSDGESASGSEGGEGTASATATDAASPPATVEPTPSGAVATGTLAEGFPTDVVPLLPGSTITVSTVTPSEGFRTVSLSGTTATPAEEVLAFYRAALVGQGFVETAGPQAAGFPTATFSRSSGADLLVLAVTTLEGVQSFTLGGALAG